MNHNREATICTVNDCANPSDGWFVCKVCGESLTRILGDLYEWLLADALRDACSGAMDIQGDYVFHAERWVATRDAARALVDAVNERDAEMAQREPEVIPGLNPGDRVTLQFRGHEFTGELWVDDKGRNRVGCWYAEGKHFVRVESVLATVPSLPRVARSLSDLQVGQVVAWFESSEDEWLITTVADDGYDDAGEPVLMWEWTGTEVILSDPPAAVPAVLPTAPGSVINARPPGRKKAFLMALREDGIWQRLDGPFDERGPFRDVTVLFDAGSQGGEKP